MYNNYQSTSITSSFLKRIIVIVLILLMIALLYLGYLWISRSSLEKSFEASIESYRVPVVSRVSAFIKTLRVKEKNYVTQGDLLLELDNMEAISELALLQSAFNQAQNDYETAKEELTAAEMAIELKTNAVEANILKYEKERKDFERSKALYEQGALAQKFFDDSKLALDLAKKELSASQQALLVAQADASVLKTDVTKAASIIEEKKLELDQIQLKLSYYKIYAPITGYVDRLNAAIGQFVELQNPVCDVVDDATLWVTATFKDEQIARIKHGQSVKIEIENPKLQLKGLVESIDDNNDLKSNNNIFTKRAGIHTSVEISIQDFQKYRSILKAGTPVTVYVKVN